MNTTPDYFITLFIHLILFTIANPNHLDSPYVDQSHIIRGGKETQNKIAGYFKSTGMTVYRH